MQAYLDKNIKEIIREFPPVVGVLDRYGIGCTTCGLGTCRFKDIIEIHALGLKEEAGLLSGIAGVIFPGQEIVIPRIERKSQPQTKSTAFSPPMQKLVDEHRLIKRLLALIPKFTEDLDLSREADRQIVSASIDFIRSYADKFHHAKEEVILFKYFDENLDIIKTICADHDDARALVRETLVALEKRDKATVARKLGAYAGLLAEHIKKEDDVLYRWMDRNLTMTQVGELFSKFNEKDNEFAGTPAKYESLINQLETKYHIQEGVK